MDRRSNFLLLRGLERLEPHNMLAALPQLVTDINHEPELSELVELNGDHHFLSGTDDRLSAGR